MILLFHWLLLSPVALAGDRDDDGINNRDDQCPEEAEVHNGYKDLDGCPDELGTVTIMVLDLDGNPVPEARVKLGSERATTPASGTVVFDDRTPTTRVELGAVAEGYVANVLADWEIPEGEATEVLVLDWEATPVTVMVVDAASREPIQANVRWDGPGHLPTEQTDPATGLAVFDARPGEWRLQASADHYQMNQQHIVVERTDNPVHRFSLVPNWMQIETRFVPFDTGSAALSEPERLKLDELAADLFGFPDTAISIEGHADDDEDHLSERRAQVVRDALVAAGIDASRMTVHDVRSTTPVASPWTAEGRASNRSARLRLQGSDGSTTVLVPFAMDSTTPPADLTERIAPIVEALQNDPAARLDVYGHRDRSEGALSLARAQAVQEQLLARGVAAERLFAIGRRHDDDLDGGVTFRLRSGGETTELPHELFFEPGTNQVEGVSVEPLREAARLAVSHPVMRIAVRGHARAETIEQAGALATARAAEIAGFFQSQGVSADRITIRGFPEIGEETEPAHRRVDFVVLPPPLLSSERIVYDAGASDPDSVAEPVLRRVADALERYPVTVQIAGTAVEADQAPASVLGRLRASKVKDALVALGVPETRLSTTGSESTGAEGTVTFRVMSVDAATAVGFHSGSDRLDADARAKLAALVPNLVLTQQPVVITGYASGADGRATLPELAEARAQAALAYLTYAGVEPARIRTSIRVEPTGGPTQRRVEVRLE